MGLISRVSSRTYRNLKMRTAVARFITSRMLSTSPNRFIANLSRQEIQAMKGEPYGHQHNAGPSGNGQTASIGFALGFLTWFFLSHEMDCLRRASRFGERCLNAF